MSDTEKKEVLAPIEAELETTIIGNEVANESKSKDESSSEKKELDTEVEKKPTVKNEVKFDEKIDEIPLGSTEEEEKPPARPARPLSPRSQATKTLKDAFPSIEDKYITAVLIASQGILDPAFNALLYISDPTFKPEIPEVRPAVPSKNRTQLEDDELLARRLAKEFETQGDSRRLTNRSDDRRRRAQRPRQEGQPAKQKYYNNDDDPDYDSEDGFEQIKKEFTQGVEEARTKLNSWVSGLTKKFQEPDSNPNKLFGALGGFSDRSSFDSNPNVNNQGQNNNQGYQNQTPNSNQRFNYNRSRNAHFDEDPEIISNDFSGIKLSNNDSAETKSILKKNSSDEYSVPKSTKPNDKWQPLAAASIEPVSSDTFLVTSDSDEEDDSKKTTLKK